MNARQMTQHIWALHANITDAPYFEGFWPIPSGVTLNSYIIRADKTALIDLYRDWENAPGQMDEQLSSIGIKAADIDYIILNHLEPDHTGFLAEFRKINTKAQIISTAKGIALVEKFCKAGGVPGKDAVTAAGSVPDSGAAGAAGGVPGSEAATSANAALLRAVKTGDSIDLGQNIVLSFTETPNVHWPETMMTYEASSGTLFSCDAFGSYGALSDNNKVFDDEFTEQEHIFFEAESLRYYATIVASFSTFVKAAAAKFASVKINAVCPSHGIVWRKNPSVIIDRYLKYAGYNTGADLEKEILVIWGSMYGYTKKGVDAVVEGIKSVIDPSSGKPLTVRFTEIPSTDASVVLAQAYKAKGLVIAMPTYEYKMYPPMAYILNLFSRKHFTGKKALRIGSWGWIGGAKKEYDEAVTPLKWDEIESFEWQGVPSADDFETLKQRGAALAQSVLGL